MGEHVCAEVRDGRTLRSEGKPRATTTSAPIRSVVKAQVPPCVLRASTRARGKAREAEEPAVKTSSGAITGGMKTGGKGSDAGGRGTAGAVAAVRIVGAVRQSQPELGSKKPVEMWGKRASGENAVHYSDQINSFMQQYKDLGKELLKARHQLKDAVYRRDHSSASRRATIAEVIMQLRALIAELEEKREAILQGGELFAEKLKNDERFAEMRVSSHEHGRQER